MKRDIIVIGASAGGVEALRHLIRTLPASLPAAVFITVHFPRTSQSVLPKILRAAGSLDAVHPLDHEPIQHGRVYVAPPDWHMLVFPGEVRLVRGPTENGNRPAVDPMFRSAAVAYGPRVVGVVLTGNLDDGTAGLMAITRRRGIGVVQNPEEALFPSMPLSAIEHGVAEHVAKLDELGGLLERLIAEEILLDEHALSDEARRETAYSAFSMEAIQDSANHPGTPSPYSCPDCGGVLWAIEDEDMLRFRCRVGHGWTNDALLMQQSESLDAALWMALRALEENAGLNRVMARRFASRGHEARAAQFEVSADLAEQRARVVREALASDRAQQPTDSAAGGAVAAASGATVATGALDPGKRE